MDCSAELQDKIDKELTYTIPTHNPLDPPQVIKNMGIIRNGLVSLPIGRTDLIPEHYEIVDKRIHVPVDFPEFRFDLRDSQKKVFDEIEDNAIINAWVSWGKTFTGLAIAGKLGQKTLVVTHTVPLRNQWAKEVEKVYGFKPGIIGSGQFDLDSPIVIGNTQTLYRNIEKIRKEFGTIILDEMHHVSSPTFSKILDTNYCRYKIGLSGTIERKDGKHVVFRDYFGNTLFKPPKENYMTPTVHLVASEIRFMDGAKVPWANRVTKLSNDEEYRHTVSMLAAAYAARGHKVLVVSDRVAFLKACTELSGDKAVCVTGEVAQEDREGLIDQILYGDANILYGTQAIFSEGISVDTLSCLILATPVNNEPLLTQLVGRVIRKKEGKVSPVIIDIHLKGNTARKQASNRVGFYMKQGWDMKYL
jgi:superfamily II DNA or RNA helicase